jgi:tetratricopeptide (TPR) repeat protein
MKRYVFLTLCLMLFCLPALAGATSQGNDKNGWALRDSILRVYRSMPADTNRVLFLTRIFPLYKLYPWLESIYKMGAGDAHKYHNTHLELKLLKLCVGHYHDIEDIPNMNRLLEELRAKSYKYRDYYYYFGQMFYMVDLYCDHGNIVYAFNKIRQWYQEAVQLKYDYGLSQTCMCWGTVYTYSGNYKKAIEAFHKALSFPEVDIRSKLNIYSKLSHCYRSLEEYTNEERYLEKQKATLDELIREEPALKKALYGRFMDIELQYLDMYFLKDNIPAFMAHMSEAKKYYSDDCFIPYYVEYHADLGRYAAIKKDWKSCISEFDKAIAQSGVSSWSSQYLSEEKIKYLMESGNLEEALKLYKKTVSSGQKKLEQFREKQRAMLLSNRQIQNELAKKNSFRILFMELIILFSAVFFILMIIPTVRLLRMYLSLQRVRKETQKATLLAKKTERMKDVLLKNIVHEIQIPLDNVMDLSGRLSANSDFLSESYKIKYAASIKKDANMLLTLIGSILDLARLEAGMTKFDIQSVNMVQSINDAIFKVEKLKDHQTSIHFQTILPSINVRIDPNYLLKVLTSLFAGKKMESDSSEIYCILSEKGDEMYLEIMGSILSSRSLTKLQELQNSINEKFFESFDGSYVIDCEKLAIRISLPIIK